MNFNSHVLGTIYTQVTSKLHSCFSQEARCLCVVWKERKKCGNVTAVAVLPLPQRRSGQTSYWHRSVGAHKPAQDWHVSSPCLRYPRFLGEGKDRKQALFLLPKPKNNQDSIAATFKPHKHSIKPAIFILWANSHRGLGFCPVSFNHYPNRSGDCGRKVHFSESRDEPVASCVSEL